MIGMDKNRITLHRILAIGLVVFSMFFQGACASSKMRDISESDMESFGYRLSQPISVAEAEALSLRKQKNRSSEFQVPFGLNNGRWNKFLDKLKEGDILVRYEEIDKRKIGPFEVSGYAIKRQDLFIHFFVTRIR